MLIDADGGPVTIAALLPGAFGPGHLETATQETRHPEAGA
jgi:hypothetical protein